MFKIHTNKLKCPYIVYADTERSLAPTGLADISHKHVPNSKCFFFVCEYGPTQNRLCYDIGPNCIVNMRVGLTKLSDECITKMRNSPEMKMTEDRNTCKNATHLFKLLSTFEGQ